MRLRRFTNPLTREGWLWLLISVAALVIALIKGINLITLLASWMLAIILLNLFWASRQIRKVKARRLLTEPSFAGTPCQVHLRLWNTSKRWAHGVGIREEKAVNHQAGFLAQLAPAAVEVISYSLLFPRRGRHKLEGLELTCGHPVGLVQLRRQVGAAEEIIVFPRLGTLQRGLLRRFLSRRSPTLGQAQAFPRRHPGAQTEFHGLRTFRAGDSPRWIHWRTTARRGELMVREFEDMPEEQLILVIEAPGPPPLEGAANPIVERTLSFASTICWDWCRQKGDQMVLALAGAKPKVIGGITSTTLALAMLEALADVRDEPVSDHGPLMDKILEAEVPAGPVLLICTRDTDLAGVLSHALNRPVAQLNIARHEEAPFFEMTL